MNNHNNHIPPQTFQTAMMAIPPVQQQQQHPTMPQAQAQAQPQGPPTHHDLTQDRWDRMAVLFQGIRNHARNFEYPAPSTAALESVLIRLYLESPMGSGACF